MLVIDLNDGVSEGIRVCKSTDVAQVQLVMSSGNYYSFQNYGGVYT